MGSERVIASFEVNIDIVETTIQTRDAEEDR